MTVVPDLITRVEAFDPGSDGVAALSQRRILELLSASPAPLSRRQYVPGHITASGIVLSPDRERILMVFHRRLARWLQPGGHVEPEDTSIAVTAAREVREETGVILVETVAPVVVGLDVHEIPGSRREPAHLHHDIVLQFRAAAWLERSRGSHDIRWQRVDRLSGRRMDGAFARCVIRAVELRD